MKKPQKHMDRAQQQFQECKSLENAFFQGLTTFTMTQHLKK